MKNDENSACLTRQDRIWDYYQNQAPEAFAQSKPRLDFLIKQISQKMLVPMPRILNIGVGNGYFEETVRQRGWKMQSLDPDKKTINRLVEKGFKAQKGVIEQIPFDDTGFDFVTASEVLEHLDDEQRHKGLQEVARVLKGGGWFLGTVPYREDLFVNRVICPKCEEVFHRWGHQKSFDAKAMRNELEPFFEDVGVRTTAFVPFRRQSVTRAIKSLVYLIRAKYGANLATTSIYFSARNGQ